MEETSVIMTGFNQERVIQSLELLSNQKRAEQRTLNMVDIILTKMCPKLVEFLIIQTMFKRQYGKIFKLILLKILIVSQYFWPENFRINELALEFLKNGHNVTVLTGLPNYPMVKFIKNFENKNIFLHIRA